MQGAVVAVVMAENDVGRLVQFVYYGLADAGADGDLEGVGQKAVAGPSQGYAGVNEDVPPLQLNGARKPAGPQGFGA